MSESPTIGLVLSGGGARGAAHIGVIHALREEGIPLTHFAGTSAGALVGVMAAAGCSTEDMLSFWMDSAPFQISNLALSQSGLFDSTTYVDTLRKYVKFENFEDLPFHFTAAVTAMVEGATKYISSGPLWPITVASAAYPLVFSPIETKDEVYMDGGLLDNMPVGALRQRCQILLGVNISPLSKISKDDMSKARGIMDRIVELQFSIKADALEDALDLMIVPPYLSAYSTFDTKPTLKIYQQGLDAGRDALPRLRKIIQEHGDKQ